MPKAQTTQPMMNEGRQKPGSNNPVRTRGLIGKPVAAEEIGNGVWKVFYRDVFLGYFNEKDIREKEKSTRLSTNWV